MRVLQLPGLGFAALALLAVGRDLVHAHRTGLLQLSSLGELWYGLHSRSLSLLQRAIEQQAPALWDPLIVTLLRLPAPLVFGGAAALLLYLPYRWRRPSSTNDRSS